MGPGSGQVGGLDRMPATPHHNVNRLVWTKAFSGIATDPICDLTALIKNHFFWQLLLFLCLLQLV